MDILKRVGSLILAGVMVLGLCTPGNIPIAKAADTGEVTGTDNAENCSVTIIAENCTLQDEQGQPIGDTYSAAIGSELAFRVVPITGYALREVLLNNQELSAAENGLFHCTVNDSGVIQAVCESIPLTAFAVTAAPEGPAREKQLQVTLVPADAAFEMATYSTAQYPSADALIAAVAAGTATVIGADTHITENGTYYVQLIDLEGNLLTQTVEVADIDQTPPEIINIVRETEKWSLETDYTVEIQADGDIANVFVQQDQETPVEIIPDNTGCYKFQAAANGTYTVFVYDHAGNVGSADVTESLIDRTGPVISATRTPDGWSTYSTFIFQAADEGSGVAAFEVTIGGRTSYIVADNEDTYQIHLSSNQTVQIKAIDQLGNESIYEIEETQIDTELPVIDSVERITQGMAYESCYRVTAHDTLSDVATVSVHYGNAEIPATKDADGAILFTASANGEYVISVTDGAGNASTATITETLLDREAPVITEITRLPDTWSLDATYTFSVTDSDSGVDSVKVFLGETEVEVAVADGKYQFLAETNGEYTVAVSDKVGNSSSIIVSETKIDRTAPVIHDASAQTQWDPAINRVTIVASDESELASVTVSDAAGTEYPVSQAEDGSYFIHADHNGEYTVTVTDAAGNTASTVIVVQRIDRTAPEAPDLESPGGEKWINTDVTLTAKANDAESGILAYWYSSVDTAFDESTWTKMDMEQDTGKVILTAEQDETYYVIAQNQAGLISEVSTIRVAIDKTAPDAFVLSYLQEENSGYFRTVEDLLIYKDFMSFHVEASDSASGVCAYEYKLVSQEDQSDWIRVAGDHTGFSDTLTGKDTLGYILVRAIDAAGNVSEEYTNLLDSGEPAAFALENTPQEEDQQQAAPDIAMYTGEQDYNGSWTAQDVTIQVSGSFAISGIETYEWRMIPADPTLDATQWEPVPVEDGIAQLVLSSDINATLSFRAVSYAGNVSLTAQAEVRIQKSAPVAAEIVPENATGTNGWYTKLPGYQIRLPEQNPYFAPVNYIVRCSHNGEVQSFTYDGTNAPTITGDGLWTIQIQAADITGNAADAQPVDFYVDTQAPTEVHVYLGTEDITNAKATGDAGFDGTVISDCNMPSDFSIFRNSSVTVTAAASGGSSGMAAIYYQVVADNQRYSKAGPWTQLPGNGLLLDPDQKCHLYFKAVDGAGNITYFTGKSLILDASAPQGSAETPELRLTPAETNRSPLGIYYGDVTVNVHVEEPVRNDAFSGLSAITYRVLADGQVTQSGYLYPGTGSVAAQDERSLSWDGQILVSSNLNNTNHIVVEVSAVDQAGNTRTSTIADGIIQIDITEPQIEAAYNENNPAAIHEDKGYFTGSRTLTVTVTERNFDPTASFVYVTNTDTNETTKYTWVSEDGKHTAILRIQEDGHYTVTASVTDAAGNNSNIILFTEGSVSGNAFVIDNTKPVVSVSYSNNTANGIYFAAPRTATVTVEDRNFIPDNFTAEISLTAEDGSVQTIPVENWELGMNLHTAEVVLSADGVYTVSVSCTDIPGNKAAETIYTGTAPQHWVLDQRIAAPQISGIQNNTPYSGTVIPTATFLDINLDKIELTLFRTRRNEILVDVTSELLSGLPVNIIDGGKQAIMDVFPETPEMDGIYKLTAKIQDKAGNSAISSMVFSVNRFGSVYAYDNYLAGIINGYHTSLSENLCITEINPTRLIAGSATVHITRDGTPIANPIFTVNPIADGTEEPGSSGWYEYQYVISKENFTQDGMYTVVLSTKDEAGNIPENTGEEIAIRFAIDTTKPDLSSVVGLEKAIVKADSLVVNFTAIDNVALKRITIYIDDSLLDIRTNLNSYTYQGTFTIPAGLNRHVRIVIEDMAGNILDTDHSEFTPGYIWQDVTVSTNLFLRFYANTPLFVSSILLGTSGIGASILLFLKKKRRIVG